MQALEKVGLGDQLHKKPNQMSGGQMQRVAIARALVNDPEILLADEPTGALDSETSVQVMELLKQIADEKLIIMVTHNLSLPRATPRGRCGCSTEAFWRTARRGEDAAEPPVQPESGKRRTSMSFLRRWV